MSRKQWINTLSDPEALKIHQTFRNASTLLYGLPVTVKLKTSGHVSFAGQQLEHDAKRRTVVRTFLRRNKLTQRDLNVQYGRLAAGFALDRKYF